MASRPLDLLQGTLDVLVLRALVAGPQHGYAVARFIRQGSDGALRVLDGALYTALHRLEAGGLLQAHWGLSDKRKRAKFYGLTAAGRRALREETGSWSAYVTAVAKVLSAVPEPA
jgi:PadR family transcriptional regulator, regulatory protein PadR